MRYCLNRSQRDRTLQQKHLCEAIRRLHASQSVPKGPYIATKRQPPTNRRRFLLVSIGPKGTVHCNYFLFGSRLSFYVSIGPKGTVHCNCNPKHLRKGKAKRGLNRSQRDRTLQLQEISGVEHRSPLSLNRSQRDRTLQLWLFSTGRNYNAGVSIGPKGTVHCNAFAK